METFGEKIRKLRKERRLPLRIVSAALDIDQAILSKIETGKKRISREMVQRIADYFNIDSKELLVKWLSGNVLDEVQDYTVALEALKVAEEEIEYREFRKIDRQQLLNKLKEGIGKFQSIQKAWIYGSFAREDDGPKSDIDIAIKTSDDISYFDLAEIQNHLEMLINRKVDVGFIQAFKPYIFEHIKPELKLIYER